MPDEAKTISFAKLNEYGYPVYNEAEFSYIMALNEPAYFDLATGGGAIYSRREAELALSNRRRLIESGVRQGEL